MALLEIHTFGGLNIHLDQKHLDGLKTRKVAALLVYVALTGQAVERTLLADLLWQELPEQKALTNLRVAISNLRKNLPSFLQITRYQVQIHPDANVWLDTLEFERNLSREYVDAALELYQGDFLQGFHLRHAPGFEDWQTLTREKYYLLLQENMHNLIETEMSQGSFKSGLLHARRLLELDPLDEFAHRSAMQFQSARGQRTAAMRQYEVCKQILADELGVDPDTETKRLYNAIAAGKFPTSQFGAPNENSSAESNLPSDLTPFVGREKEVEQTINLIMDSANRLVTILGAGGMGKTRLALEASRHLEDHFADGVYFVPLASLDDPETIPSKIAEILGIQLQTGLEDHLQLINFLSRKNLLLVLDNIEHLLAGRALIKDMLKAAPLVQVLMTSREKLNIPGETIVYLKGMQYPLNDDPAEIEKFGSLKLFLQTALRARPDFEANQDNVQAIVGICQLVDGLPLGIELAAARVDHLPVAVIAEEVGKSSGFLATSTDASANRQHSVRAVFESSWGLLTPAEQIAFAKLSVFRGGFTSRAAKEIAGVGLRLLSLLFNKSLLYPPKDGRYHIHELLRQFAAEKLAESAKDEIRTQNLHTKYFADLIHQHEEQLSGGNWEVLLVEVDNLRASWRFAVLEGRYADIQNMVRGFAQVLEFRGWIQEGVSTFSWAEKQIRDEEPTMESRLTYGMLLFRYGYFLSRSGQRGKAAELICTAYDILCEINAEEECARVGVWMVELAPFNDKEKTEKHLRKSLTVFEKLNLPREITFARFHMGHNSRHWGEFDKAEMIYQETYRENVKNQNDVGAALSLMGLGQVTDYQADYALAQQKYEEANSLFREVDLVPMVGVLNKYLGNVHLVQNAYKAAEEYFKKYLELNQETGIEWRLAEAQQFLARVAIERADFDTAHRYLDKAVTSGQSFEDPSSLGNGYCYLGQLSFRQGDHQIARQRFLDALQVSQKVFSVMEVGLLVMALAAPLLAEFKKITHATEMASLAASHPGKLQQFVQHEARKALESLKDQLPEAEFNAAVARGSVKEYEPARLELIKMLTHLTR